MAKNQVVNRRQLRPHSHFAKGYAGQAQPFPCQGEGEEAINVLLRAM